MGDEPIKDVRIEERDGDLVLIVEMDKAWYEKLKRNKKLEQFRKSMLRAVELLVKVL